MDVGLASVLFLIVALGWILLPLLPALHELRFRTDAQPLQVVRRSDTNIRHFALGFREFLQKHFAHQLEECASTSAPIAGALTDGTPYRVLPADMERPPSGRETEHEDPYLTLSCGNLNLAASTIYPHEVYSRGSLRTGRDSSLRAALAERSIYLAEGCTSFRWLHAGAEVHAGAGCRLYGRVSAERLIRLDDDCGFERLHAPTIEFGRRADDAPAPERRRTEPLDLSRHEELADHSAGRYLFRRKLEIPAGARIEGDVVVAGRMRIGDGAHILGSLKSHDDLEIGAGVRIEGGVVSGRHLALGDDCVVDGPVVAEQKAEIGAGCVLGTPERPTTLSARGLKIGPGTIAHGTVWGGDA